MSGTRNGSKKAADESEVVEVDVSALGATAAPKSGTSGTTPKAMAKSTKKVKYPCGKCDLEVSCGVACNSCEIWFHDKCVEGMTKEYFDNCRKTHDIYGYTGFLCKICRKVFSSVNKALKETKSELKAVIDRVMVLELEKEALAQKVEKMEKGAEKVTERVDVVAKEVATGMEKAKQEVKDDVKSEMAEREERSSNIVIYGLEETKEDDVAKWRETENKKVADMVEQIGVLTEGEVAIKFRAGKRREDGEKPRPLIV